MEATANPLDTVLNSFQAEAGKSLWQTITGFDAKTEPSLAHDKRRQSLRKLLHAVKQLIGAEIQLDETLPPEEKEERTVFWNPLPAICNHLGIARSKLTSFMKELTGVGAHELVDQQRVKDLKVTMRDELRECARALRANHHRFHLESFSRMEEMLAECVKQRRAENGICDPMTMALSYKIPTYPRFYRACLVVHKKSPAQLEAKLVSKVIDEILEAESKRPSDVQEKYGNELALETQLSECDRSENDDTYTNLDNERQIFAQQRQQDHKKRLEKIAARLQQREQK